MKPRTSAEIRAFLNKRADSRPQNAIPAIKMDGTVATLRLFDPIDSWGEWWGMSAKELAQALDDLPAHIATIEVLINSPGGDAFDGLAMVNVLRAHPAQTRAVVQGIAASAASFIACACDETVMAPNSTMMIHDAWGMCVGNADDMLSFGTTLDQLSGNLADIYAAKSGKSSDDMRTAMKAETWYTAEEAIAAGLANSLGSAEPEPVANEVKPRPVAEAPSFDLIAANANRRRR
jgi:ATP-dependent protease ClpP protease subunit